MSLPDFWTIKSIASFSFEFEIGAPLSKQPCWHQHHPPSCVSVGLRVIRFYVSLISSSWQVGRGYPQGTIDLGTCLPNRWTIDLPTHWVGPNAAQRDRSKFWAVPYAHPPGSRPPPGGEKGWKGHEGHRRFYKTAGRHGGVELWKLGFWRNSQYINVPHRKLTWQWKLMANSTTFEDLFLMENGDFPTSWWLNLKMLVKKCVGHERSESTFTNHIQKQDTGWWFQPIWQIVVKMGIFPK